MLRKDQEESGRGRTNMCEMMRQLCWKGSGAFVLGWGFYVVFLVLSTHPCWQSSDCWAALLIGSQSANKFAVTRPSVNVTVGTFNGKESGNGSVYSTAGALNGKENGNGSVNSTAGTVNGNDTVVEIIGNGNATGLEHIVFGIAASADKWKWRKEYVDLWWQPGKNRGYVWLDRPAPEPWPANSPPFRISEDTSRFQFTHPNGYRSAIRVSRIVAETFRMGLPNVRWFVMGDDDTVFFTENLVKVLGKYDHNQYYYIGSNSECAEQNAVHSFHMAFGGGGFAISYPLAKALANVQDECLGRYSELYGSDQRVHACLAELGVPLTKEPGFHQMDLHGSLLGILAAHPLTPLVSLHHLDVVAPVFPKMTRVGALRHLMEAAKADPDRLVQQSMCYDRKRKWTVSVSWGYSLQIYGRVLHPRVLEYPLETFGMWRGWARFPFVFNTRPLSKHPCENPTVLYMEGVLNAGSKLIASGYTRPAGLDENRCNATVNNPDEIRRVTVVSEKMSADWTRAPRRHCCDVVSSSKYGMEVSIRSCKDGESMSPP